MRIVVVGLDPGKNGTEPLDPGYPSGKRLADLCGLSPGDFSSKVSRVNLHCRAQPLSEDERAADNLRLVLRGQRVLALGSRVGDALGVPQGLLSWKLCQGFVGARVPHPSGRCRWWNDPDSAQSARQFLGILVRPCVHLEGTDGSGKTTLAKWLAAAGRLKLVPTDGPAKDWQECLGRIERRLDPGLVCDRSSGLVSELVYGPVLRGGTVAPEEEMWATVRSVLGSVTFVYCRPPDQAVKPTFRKGEDPGHVRGVKDSKEQLQAKYDEVICRLSKEGARVVRYDWTAQSPGEVLSCLQ